MDQVAQLEKDFPPLNLKSIVRPKSFLFLVLMSVCSLLVTIISTGSYYLYNENHTQPPAVPIIVASVTPTQAPEKPIDATKEWQTYSSDKRKLTFKYPPTYQIVSDYPTALTLGFKETGSRQVLPFLTIKTANFTPYETYKACSDDPTFPCLNGSLYLQKQDVVDTQVASVSAKSYYYTEGPDSVHHVIVTNKAPKIEFNMNVAGGGLDYTFQQILKSVEFTDQSQAADTSTWKTYRDPKNRFTLEYPSKNVSIGNYDEIIDKFAIIGAGAKTSFFLLIHVTKTNSTVEQEKQSLEKIKNIDGFQYTKLTPYTNGQITGFSYNEHMNNGDQEGDSQGIFMIRNGYEYSFDFADGTNVVQAEARKIIEQILSTFKFTQ
jgi:hypothetical protein